MTRIDKFHALPIGQQLNVLASITNTYMCKYCIYCRDGIDLACKGDKGANCYTGHAMWWLGEYNKSDF